MSLTAAELKDVLSELAAQVPGARLQKINAPAPDIAQLFFRHRDRDCVLLLALAPGRTRVHLIEEKLPSLGEAPAWIMKCRKEIAGGFLERIAQEGTDRIVRLEFRCPGTRPRRTLLAELFGKRGRLLLLDGEDQILQGLLGEAAPGERYLLSPPTSPRTPLASRFPAPDPLTLATNQAVAIHYAQAESQHALDHLKRALSAPLEKERRRVLRRIDHQEKDLHHTELAPDLARQGEILKTHLHALKKGQTQAELSDPFHPDGATVKIALDPARSPVENMKRLFARSRRLQSACAIVSVRLASSRAEQERLERALQAIAGAPSLEQLDRVRQQLGLQPVSPTPSRKKPAQERRLPYRSHLSASGKTILVGRSGKDNHNLTFRVAKGSDLWMHASGTAGAHVLVLLARGESFDEQTLLDAATLAAASSGARDEPKVEILYTLAKHVHAIKGAQPGAVSVAQGKTLLLKIEPERLQRLRQGSPLGEAESPGEEPA